MPIDTQCTGCGRQLRVADEHAGRNARCPVCGTIYAVPAAGATVGVSAASPSLVSAAAVSSNVSPAAGASNRTASLGSVGQASREPRWYMRTPEGQTYGPVSRSGLDQWVADGRVTADCELRMDDSTTWQSADHVYPVLRPATRPAASGVGRGGSAGAFRTGPAASAGLHAMGFTRTDRGGLILTLGILGIVMGCPILSIMAWVMGTADLNEMRGGRMNPAGMGLTQAGQIIGMICSLAWIVMFVLGLFILLIAATK